MISPNFSLVCIKAQLLWSLVVTALLRRGDILGAIMVPSASNDTVKLFPNRTIGDEPRRLVDICRPATPPIILEKTIMSISIFAI